MPAMTIEELNEEAEKPVPGAGSRTIKVTTAVGGTRTVTLPARPIMRVKKAMMFTRR